MASLRPLEVWAESCNVAPLVCGWKQGEPVKEGL